jgi:hypothetical protein
MRVVWTKRQSLWIQYSTYTLLLGKRFGTCLIRPSSFWRRCRGLLIFSTKQFKLLICIIYFSAFNFSVLKNSKIQKKIKKIKKLPKILFQSTLSYKELCVVCFMRDTKTGILHFDPNIDITELALRKAA